jgi:hypothetical protein
MAEESGVFPELLMETCAKLGEANSRADIKRMARHGERKVFMKKSDDC